MYIFQLTNFYLVEEVGIDKKMIDHKITNYLKTDAVFRTAPAIQNWLIRVFVQFCFDLCVAPLFACKY